MGELKKTQGLQGLFGVFGAAQARCGTGLHGSDVLIASFVALAALAEETALEDTSRAAIHGRGLALILKNMT